MQDDGGVQVDDIDDNAGMRFFLHRHRNTSEGSNLQDRFASARTNRREMFLSLFFLSRVKVVSVLASLQLRIMKFSLSLVSDLLLFCCDPIPCTAQACAFPSTTEFKKDSSNE